MLHYFIMLEELLTLTVAFTVLIVGNYKAPANSRLSLTFLFGLNCIAQNAPQIQPVHKNI